MVPPCSHTHVLCDDAASLQALILGGRAAAADTGEGPGPAVVVVRDDSAAAAQGVVVRHECLDVGEVGRPGIAREVERVSAVLAAGAEVDLREAGHTRERVL